MSCPSQSSWLDHPNDIWWGVHSIKLFIMHSSPLPCSLILFGPKYPSRHPILENPQPTTLVTCKYLIPECWVLYVCVVEKCVQGYDAASLITCSNASKKQRWSVRNRL
jgi:hypothetical protein